MDASADMLRQLGERVGKEQFERYFLGQTRLVMRDGSLDVIASSGILARLIERRFSDHLRAITGATSLRFTISRDGFETSNTQSVREAVPVVARVDRPARANLSLRKRLDEYLVGDANRLAFTAATRLADPDAPAAPVFIHGVCGVGKTHLVQGAANLYLERCPGAKVRYVTGEVFTNDFVQAIRAGRVDQFRRVYRDAGLLVIDDVHFLSHKDATQQELLHTFDTLGMSGARILIASDEHPREILKISEKLVSRFMSGAVVRIDAPDPALRRALIRAFALRRCLALDDDSVEVLAQRSERATGSLGGFGGSVRELEGLLNQVEALARLGANATGARSSHSGYMHVTPDVTRRALGLEVRQSQTPGADPQPRRPIPIQAIVDHVCRSLHVDLDDFTGRGRHKRVVFARSVVAELSRELTTQSFPEIARGMGRSNHSTIITAQRRLKRQLESEPHQTLPTELAPMHAGVTLIDFLRSLASAIRQSAR